MDGQDTGKRLASEGFQPTRAAAIRFLVGHLIASLGMVLIAIALVAGVDGLFDFANYLPFVGFLVMYSGLFASSGKRFSRYSWSYFWGEAGWRPAVRAANLPTGVVGARWLAAVLLFGSFLVMGVHIATKGFPES